jgi:hypothetical protein
MFWISLPILKFDRGRQSNWFHESCLTMIMWQVYVVFYKSSALFPFVFIQNNYFLLMWLPSFEIFGFFSSSILSTENDNILYSKKYENLLSSFQCSDNSKTTNDICFCLWNTENFFLPRLKKRSLIHIIFPLSKFSKHDYVCILEKGKKSANNIFLHYNHCSCTIARGRLMRSL